MKTMVVATTTTQQLAFDDNRKNLTAVSSPILVVRSTLVICKISVPFIGGLSRPAT